MKREYLASNRYRYASGLALVLLLAGCADDRVCTKPPSLDENIKTFGASTPEATSGAQSETVASRIAQEGCVHRWAYRLADADDPALIVARATLAVCETSPAWSSAARARLYAQSNPNFDSASYRAWQREELSDLALFHVVQARAGRCRRP